MMLYAICAVALSQIEDVRVATLVFLPAGIGWTGTFSSLSALVQLWTPDRLRARIIALYSMLHLGMWAIGATLGGSIADAKSVRAAMLVGACVCALTSLITARLPLPASFTGPPGSIPPPPPTPETVPS
jgi:MFS family permease